jgi:hypothetical protein
MNYLEYLQHVGSKWRMLFTVIIVSRLLEEKVTNLSPLDEIEKKLTDEELLEADEWSE